MGTSRPPTISKPIIDEKTLRAIANEAIDQHFERREVELARAYLQLLDERRLLVDVLEKAELKMPYMECDDSYVMHCRKCALKEAIKAARAAVAGVGR